MASERPAGASESSIPAPASSPVAPVAATPSSALWTLVVTTAIQAIASMGMFTLPAMAPAVAGALGVSAALVGVYVALCYLAAMVFSLLGGPMVQRMGAIRASQVGLLISTAGLLLTASGWLPALVPGALLLGAGYGPINPGSSHLLVRSTPAHRLSLVFSIKQTGVPLGGMLAGALVPSSALTLGWQWTLVLVALACVGCALLAQPLRASLDADRQPGRPLVLGTLFEPLRLVARHRSLAVAQFAGVFARVGWGMVADRGLGPRNTLILLSALMTLSCVGVALLQASWPTLALWAVVALLGASAIGWNGVYLAAVARQAPAGQASVATGGTLMFTFFGVVAGAPAFGALAGASGSYRVAFAALTIPAALALSLLVWRAAQVRREAANEAKVASK